MSEQLNKAVDPFDFVEPCEPECSAERHAYHQGQWDMAGRINEHYGLPPYPAEWPEQATHPTPNTADELDTLVRDLTKVHPLSKSEVRRRLLAWRDSYTNDKVAAARVDELNVPRTYKLDDSKSDDYKQGFADALEQVSIANVYREAQLTNPKQEQQ